MGNQVQYWIYTDKGYVNLSHVRCAHHGPAHVTAQDNIDRENLEHNNVN
jgi:hypothetical protein